MSIGSLPERGRAYCRGYVSAVTVVPANDPPRFTAVVEDAMAEYREIPPAGRAKVRLVWVGQRRVPGIEAGTWLAFEGMVSAVDGRPTIFNPRYEIIGRPEAES
ncbi:OB-fold nucleic acid binding domain-containing protein [Arthrobacter yangruifuii]|uniref:OB-fold nucleic acid binding domain-containing protein n=1 Tax=Arthrobacter yangruifuii TaxID=2606616 RepID=UPI0011B4ACF4|nr:OB-fold nucleic acid binding domain-containing protein [Arthrobacter yangruifuii]